MESWGEGPVREAERDTQLFSLPSGEGDAAQAARGGVFAEGDPLAVIVPDALRATPHPYPSLEGRERSEDPFAICHSPFATHLSLGGRPSNGMSRGNDAGV